MVQLFRPHSIPPKALQAAAGVMMELKIFEMAKFDGCAGCKAIDGAEEHIKTCFDTFAVYKSY
jgi:hypothetical protein